MDRETARKRGEILLAYANGASIECRHNNGSWIQSPRSNPNFLFDEGFEYRVANPKSKYRVALVRDDGPLIAENQGSAEQLENASDFIRWLTDWVEYDN
jgi:hypothetical protein